VIVAIVVFNVVMLALGAAVAARTVPANLVSALLSGIHNTIGITQPKPEKERLAALIWIASVLAIADGALFMLVFLATRLMRS